MFCLREYDREAHLIPSEVNPGRKAAMGLLDGILSNVAGSVLGGGQAQGASPLDALVNSLGAGNQKGGADLLGAVMAMVQQNGGLPGVIDKLRASGLGQQADSWVGTGPNAGVSPDDSRRSATRGWAIWPRSSARPTARPGRSSRRSCRSS